MKKLLLAMVMVGLVSWFPMSAVAEDEVIYGCYKEKKGRLRIVDDPSVCRRSEVAISFNELDADLVSGNIRSGVSIFGVVGTYPLAGLEKTGQATPYETGDDGDLQKGIAWPSPRFSDNADGTVTDNLTGLIWLRNANCAWQRNWPNALAFANSLYDGWDGASGGGDCGLSDGSSAGEWRLPNVKELLSLIDFGNYDPALPSGHPFTGVQSYYYWSSTTLAHQSDYAWFVFLDDGLAGRGNKDLDLYVWPVRGGQ